MISILMTLAVLLVISVCFYYIINDFMHSELHYNSNEWKDSVNHDRRMTKNIARNIKEYI